MSNILNLKNVDTTKEPLFFGQGLNLQRYDVQKYPKLYQLFKDQLGFFWRPEEIGISKDQGDFQKLTDHEKFIFTKNLGYQILLDSVQSRGIGHLLHDCSNPEFEIFCKGWEFSETIHSYSYTYIIKNIYPNPTAVFDSILEDEEIAKRAISVTKKYDDLINGLSDDNEFERKKKLYLTLVSINILEGIRFYVSFACSYCFAQNKSMTGNASIISLINRDENVHLAFTQNTLNYLRTVKSEGFQDVVNDCKDIVFNMFKDAAEEEIQWAKYLFKDGSLLGLNDVILTQYMKHLCNRRTKAIKVESVFEETPNPINWITHWTDSKAVQKAPQEEEIESYIIGSFVHDEEDASYSEFDDLV
jgi:ribonucleotide reductase beta subunit family protein with ferritin-like domain